MRALLNAIDRREFSFYENLSDEEKKGFKAIVTLRWLSAASTYDLEELLVVTVNTYANQHFYDISDHPELQYMLMAACGRGRAIRHDWIAMPKQASRRSIVHEWLSEMHPSANDFELDLLFEKLTTDSLKALINEFALPPDRTKALLDAFKKAKKA